MPPETALDSRPSLRPAAPARPAPGRRPAPLTVVAREVELIVNARASGSSGRDVLGEATAALRDAGARVRSHLTADEGELAAVVRGAEDRRIVIAGGDGTVHALANLDLPALPPAALLPAGRANNVARALGIPVEWKAAARLAVRGRPAALDALHVVTPQRSLYAVEGVSAGFHAAARHRYNGENSADLAAGVRALAAELRAFRPSAVALRVDGAQLFAGPAAQVFLSNLPFFGFGFRVDPIADPVRRPAGGDRHGGGHAAGHRRPARRRPRRAAPRARGRQLEPREARAPGAAAPARRGRSAARRHDRRGHGRPGPPAPRRPGGPVVSVMTLPIRRQAPGAAAAALWAFAAVAVALGAARAITTTYVPVLLERIADRPGLIGAVMLVNAAAGFAVPLATGLWSDRRGTRGPFILGGAVVAAGGLVAIALGTTSSYLVLALAAATVYVGLNAASTAHRALVAERFAADRRAAATGAQEGAMLAGALAGTVAGGALIDGSAAALFVLWAIALPLLALPTLAWQRAAAPIQAADADAGHGSPLRLFAEVLRRDGARHVLIAQVLWVGSYAALAPFMVLYAEDVLGLSTAAAGILLAGFGLLTGVGMLVGARMSAERLRETLLTGVALLGGGLLAGTAASNLAQGAVPFAAAALGAGLVSAVGFPYFTRFVPEGQAGRYAGAFFSARAIASTAALPAAGLLIAATGSYRALLGMGALGLVALVPLARAERRSAGARAAARRPRRRRLPARRSGG